MSELFVVFPPLTGNGSIIVGRNSFSFCCKEIVLIKPGEATTKVNRESLRDEFNRQQIDLLVDSQPLP